MKQAIRGLGVFLLPRTAALLGLTGGFGLLAILTGAFRGDASRSPAWLMGSYPILLLLVLFFSAWALGGPVLNLLLSMGCRRRDYWLAGEWIFLFLSLLAWLLWHIVLALPSWLGGTYSDQLRLQLDLGGQLSQQMFLFSCFAAPPAGAAAGVLSSDSRFLGRAAAAAALLITLLAGLGVYLFSISGGVDYGSQLPRSLCIFFGGVWLLGQILWGWAAHRRTL